MRALRRAVKRTRAKDVLPKINRTQAAISVYYRHPVIPPAATQWHRLLLRAAYGVRRTPCRTQLMDVVDNIWISVTAKNFVYSKAHMLIAPIILQALSRSLKTAL